jgi:putative ABC transport system substrate-binding protein
MMATAVAWPSVAWAQKQGEVRRVGLLVSYTESTVLGKDVVGMLKAQLARRGWVDGRNLQLNARRKLDDATRVRTEAKTLVQWKADVIFCSNAALLASAREASDTIPMVFVQVADPVGQGLVKSLSRPGGNVTGIASYDFSMAGRWLQTLKDIVPGLGRVALIYNQQSARANPYFVKAFESAAGGMRLALTSKSLSTDAGIRGVMQELGGKPDSGFVVLAEPFATAHRDSIISQAARNKVPGIYPYRHFAAAGGLCSYGIDVPEAYQLGADYIDRILNGEKPAQMPVFRPQRFQLVLNLKTAKALKLAFPPAVLGKATEVIK